MNNSNLQRCLDAIWNLSIELSKSEDSEDSERVNNLYFETMDLVNQPNYDEAALLALLCSVEKICRKHGIYGKLYRAISSYIDYLSE